MSESPFDRYGLDPRASVAQITERLRELAEDAPDEEERRAIRAAWESLTMHADARVEAVLDTFPETRPELVSMPPAPRARDLEDAPLGMLDLLPPPALTAVLHAPDREERALCGPAPLSPDLSSPSSPDAGPRALHGTRRS